MDRPDALITLQQQAQTHIVTFTRDIHNPEAIEQVHSQLCQMIDQTSAPRLILDFARLRNVGSSFLGMIMAITLQTTRKNGQVRVCNMTPEVKDLFALTRLDKIVPLQPSLDEALASFN